jgi:hypothetical protein
MNRPSVGPQGPSRPISAEVFWYGWIATATLGAFVIASIDSCVVARLLVSPVEARMGMGGAGPRNDRVRLPDDSLVPTIGDRVRQS